MSYRQVNICDKGEGTSGAMTCVACADVYHFRMCFWLYSAYVPCMMRDEILPCAGCLPALESGPANLARPPALLCPFKALGEDE